MPFSLFISLRRAHNIEGLVQDCSNSSALAMELLQFCTKPSICRIQFWCHHLNALDFISGSFFLQAWLTDGKFYFHFRLNISSRFLTDKIPLNCPQHHPSHHKMLLAKSSWNHPTLIVHKLMCYLSSEISFLHSKICFKMLQIFSLVVFI